MPGGVESNLGDDFHSPCVGTYSGGANIIDEGPSHEIEVDKSHMEDQTATGQHAVDDFHSPCV
ncbi:Hypothetical predicted protein, partial [Olea europaea subsp. europaea]